MWLRIIFFIFILNFCARADAQGISISPQEIQKITERVFENECSGKNECLLEWNDGEEFMSLGIGHFIWYPRGQMGPFEESFPKFLEYLKSTGEKVPGWLNTTPAPGCPWASKDDLLKNHRSPQAIELRQLLLSTKSKQGDFLVKRLNDALPLMLKRAPQAKRQQIREQFYRVAGAPTGVYALVDYVNFKGLGTSSAERYHGKGWGLLQVLSDMHGQNDGRKALEEFVQAADKVLVERVKNAPPDRKEEKWLPGWQSRITSYLEFTTKK